MSEPPSSGEALEDRLASWLNGFMWYGLASLAAVFGVWILIGSVWDSAAILDGLSFRRLEAVDSARAWTGVGILASGIGALLQTWNRTPTR